MRKFFTAAGSYLTFILMAACGSIVQRVTEGSAGQQKGGR